LSSLDLLLALPRYADVGAAAYKPGLDRMRALLEGMGRPHTAFPSVVIGGTNGKGSTASFAAAILTAAGRRVGLHTSPHLLSITERMRVDGQPAAEEWLENAADRHQALFDESEASFFEATTALALDYFSQAGVDAAVVEVGMGGRLDATNVLVPAATAVTNVLLDHVEILGETIAAIAAEKAGIAKAGVPFLTAATGEAIDVLRRHADGVGAFFEDVRSTTRIDRSGVNLAIQTRDRVYSGLTLGLPGEHQWWNAALAVRLAEVVAPGVTTEAVRVGLSEVVRLAGLRGRGESPPGHPRLILDVAHNADGWAAALATACRSPGPLVALVGVMADKDTRALAEMLASRGIPAIPVELPSPRALGLGELVAVLRDEGAEVLDAPTSVAGALDWYYSRFNRGERLLVTGSHVTVGETLRALGWHQVSR
jgi:dihydrofolate synthase/folylpolyglutamate synthase